jgi:PTH2 family peptidyl-tRNA hydrolase
MEDSSTLVVGTALASFASGFLLGVYAIRGYFISPDLAEERRRAFNDPVESDESDIDEKDGALDHAPSWVNGRDADRKQGLSMDALREKQKREQTQPKIEDLDEECKLVLVVRTDLGMTKGTHMSDVIHVFMVANSNCAIAGKIAAQCSHATLACYKALARAPAGSPESQILRRWERLGQAKIAVQTKSQEEMLSLRQNARNLGLTAEVIQDAGRTQIEAGSMTVLGVGPAAKSLVNKITGHLKLL